MAKGDEKKTPPDGEVVEKDPGTGTETVETSQVDEKQQEPEKEDTVQEQPPKSRTRKEKPPAKSTEEEPPATPVTEKEIVGLHVRVPPFIRDKAKQEAELAHLYGWIPEPTVQALFIWLINYYLDAGIKQWIAQRRALQGEETSVEQDKTQEANHG